MNELKKIKEYDFSIYDISKIKADMLKADIQQQAIKEYDFSVYDIKKINELKSLKENKREI